MLYCLVYKTHFWERVSHLGLSNSREERLRASSTPEDTASPCIIQTGNQFVILNFTYGGTVGKLNTMPDFLTYYNWMLRVSRSAYCWRTFITKWIVESGHPLYRCLSIIFYSSASYVLRYWGNMVVWLQNPNGHSFGLHQVPGALWIWIGSKRDVKIAELEQLR